jgi:hypothetical protein
VNELATDVMIDGLHAQNCALDGDTVLIEMIPAVKWKVYDRPKLQKKQKSTEETKSD